MYWKWLLIVAGFLGSTLNEKLLKAFESVAEKKIESLKNEWQAANNLKNKVWRTQTLPVGEVHYMPVDELHPETGRRMFKFCYVDNDVVDLRKVFDPAASDLIIEYINGAAKHCNGKNIFVLDHLDKVVPSEKIKDVRALITEQWKTFFSSYYNTPQPLSVEDLKNGLFPTYVERYPVLVAEDINGKKNISVRFHMSKEGWEDKPDSSHLYFYNRGQWKKDGEQDAHGDTYKNIKYETDCALDEKIRTDEAFRNDTVILMQTGDVNKPRASTLQKEFANANDPPDKTRRARQILVMQRRDKMNLGC